MGSRLELQSILEITLKSRNVYFQPPATVELKYPAIVYALNDIDTKNADNTLYLKHKNYTVTLIDKNPDTTIVDDLLLMPFCSFNKHFKSENLNHYVFSLYF